MEGKSCACDCGEKPNTRPTVKVKSVKLTVETVWEPTDPDDPQFVACADAFNKNPPSVFHAAPDDFHVLQERDVTPTQDSIGGPTRLVPGKTRFVISGALLPE